MPGPPWAVLHRFTQPAWLPAQVKPGPDGQPVEQTTLSAHRQSPGLGSWQVGSVVVVVVVLVDVVLVVVVLVVVVVVVCLTAGGQNHNGWPDTVMFRVPN